MSPCPRPDLISRYAAGDVGLDDAAGWAVEAHLESCASCRALLVDAVDPPTQDLLDRVARTVAAGIAVGPAPVRRRPWRRTGVLGRSLPWLAVAAGLMLAAVGFEKVYPDLPSLVLLVAPVAPLLPVAAAWSRRTDPAWELLVSTPRNGLGLLLRRTLTVLAVVLPVLAAAGWGTGHSPALWLLPCLAFTAGSLALGALVGVDRAAVGLAAAWAAGVIVPSISVGHLPAVL
ncbi:zf-HC2 domain-containing protein, partial [Micromonospora zhanjiangensis]